MVVWVVRMAASVRLILDRLSADMGYWQVGMDSESQFDAIQAEALESPRCHWALVKVQEGRWWESARPFTCSMHVSRTLINPSNGPPNLACPLG